MPWRGALAVGKLISGTGVTPEPGSGALGTGNGGTGTYNVHINQQTVSSATAMTARAYPAAGIRRIGQHQRHHDAPGLSAVGVTAS